MTLNEYQQLAAVTANKDRSQKEALTNAAMGLCGESGEVTDLVKKHLFHGHPLDEENLKKEMGDVLWYLADMATAMGYSLDDIAQMNIEKLKKRYPDGFDSERSIHR